MLLFHPHYGSFCAGYDKGIHYSASFWGSYFVDFNSTDKTFFFSAQCHRIDVVSGCGKNAEGAAQTLSLVFHNLSQKPFNSLPAKVRFSTICRTNGLE